MAANHSVAYELAQAGGITNVRPMGMWWAAVPRKHWGHPEGQQPDQSPSWHPRFGDRIQEIVFIGQKMDEAKIRNQLDACLLEERLASSDSEAWADLHNPFPDLAVEEAA